MIVITLNSSNPENYDVTVGGVKLDYDSTAKEFTGDVLENDATVAKADYSRVIITKK